MNNQKDAVPLAHYQACYEKLDPHEAATRTGLAFDGTAFHLRLMGADYRAAYPAFALQDAEGREISSAVEKILLIRYLCEGKYFPATDKRLAYNEIPWGEVYYRNFDGRCLKRLAHTFGHDIPGFKRLMEAIGEKLRAETLPVGDAGYRFEFLNDLFITVILWGADDEFPPSAQMLFDDNFIFAFTAEDLAAVGETVIKRLKQACLTPARLETSRV
jgi:hypothetical protein